MASQKKLSEQKEINLLEDFTLSTYEEWREAVDNLLKGAPFEKVMITPTYEGIKQQPMYRQEDVADITHPESWPGFAPFVRGNRAAGYLSKSWYIAQEIPASTPAAFNEALQHDMAYGQTAVNLTIDNATAQGLDSDQSSADAIGVGGLTL
ncbi:MAG: methylmalonyl-CoA mutase, partial [Aliifodinibius sp.]|nr:methylmalonyl-CoA mutase [Fodinibius sp.]